MRVLHLTLLTFCQVLLASFILYSRLTSASPVVGPKNEHPAAPVSPPVVSKPIKDVSQTKIEPKTAAGDQIQTPAEPKAAAIQSPKDQIEPKSASIPNDVAPKSIVSSETKVKPSEQIKSLSSPADQKAVEAKPSSYSAESSMVVPEPVKPVVVPVKMDTPEVESVLSPRKEQPVEQQPTVVAPVQSEVVAIQKIVPVSASAPTAQESPVEVPKKPEVPVSASTIPVAPAAPKVPVVQAASVVPAAPVAPAASIAPVSELVSQLPKAEALIAGKSEVVKYVKPEETIRQVINPVEHKESPASSIQEPVKPVVDDIKPVEVKLVVPVTPIAAPVVPVVPVVPVAPVVPESKAKEVVVNGGLGPLHLLASTLCSYQPDRPVADETVNQLYSQRAAVRKSLFEFMSLKFTNLEKLSSRLNPGLEVMPAKVGDANRPGETPSHGWPVVGQCTAHDLRLMSEAAWCECAEGSSCGPSTKSPFVAVAVAAPAPVSTIIPSPPSSGSVVDSGSQVEPSNRISGNRHMRAAGDAELASTKVTQGQQADQSSVISKLLHVADVKDAPVVESSIAGINLTQQQLDKIQAQVTSTRECRRNALKLTRALFNHLAEDQRSASASWPALYAQMSADDCARKRMIDVVNALSTFRSESSSIRRDNLEFAFAMDDLRAKVLESEVNVPLTFDKQFIEVEQFLQQSVKLMLANIDPEKAKLTSMRYRALIPAPLSADDQCIDLPQRLLAKNQPTGCNPNQFGQLPDVLRMTAKSLELWSIENELSRRLAKGQEYADAAQRSDVRECVANLVVS